MKEQVQEACVGEELLARGPFKLLHYPALLGHERGSGSAAHAPPLIPAPTDAKPLAKATYFLPRNHARR